MKVLKKIQHGNCTIVFVEQNTPSQEDTETLHGAVAELLVNNMQKREKTN